MKSTLLIICVVASVIFCDLSTQGAEVKASSNVVIAVLYDPIDRGVLKTEWFASVGTMKQQPRWDCLTGEIPLSPSRACQLAYDNVRSRFPSVKEWSVESIYLQNLVEVAEAGKSFPYTNVWCFQVTFKTGDKTVMAKILDKSGYSSLASVVLLDGTVADSTSQIVTNQKKEGFSVQRLKP